MSLESHIILEHRDPSIVNIQIPDSRDALVIEALTHPHTSIQCNRRRGGRYTADALNHVETDK